jgi:hypothetical protein
VCWMRSHFSLSCAGVQFALMDPSRSAPRSQPRVVDPSLMNNTLDSGKNLDSIDIAVHRHITRLGVSLVIRHAAMSGLNRGCFTKLSARESSQDRQ